VSGAPADPWRSDDRDPFVDLVQEGSLILDQIAALLDRDEEGAQAARRAVLALSPGDLQEAVFYAALERMLDERRRRRERERRERLVRPWRWRPWRWRPWRVGRRR
jgi:hypothetical protein